MTEALLDNPSMETELTAEAPQHVTVAADNPVTEQPQSEDVLSGTPMENWRDFLPEEYREDPSLKNFKDIGDLAKSYVHAQKTIGKKFEDLSPEELGQYYTKMGRPETVEDYKFDLGEHEGVDENTLAWFKGAAHDAGLSEEAAQKVLGQYLEYESTEMSKLQALQNQQQEAQIQEVKDMFGADFDSKLNYANKALRELGGDDAVNAIKEAGLASNPALVRMLSNMGELISEGALVNASSKVGHAMTPDQAAEKITERMQDPDFLRRWKNPIDPGHNGAIKELEQLYRIRSGRG